MNKRLSQAAVVVAGVSVGIGVTLFLNSAHEESGPDAIVVVDHEDAFDTSDPEQLAGAADDVIIGRVVREEAEFDEERVKRFEVELIRSLRDFKYASKTLYVVQDGGTFETAEDGVLEVRNGQQPIKVGETYVLVLNYIDGRGYYWLMNGEGSIAFVDDTTVASYERALAANVVPEGLGRAPLDAAPAEPLLGLPTAEDAPIAALPHDDTPPTADELAWIADVEAMCRETADITNAVQTALTSGYERGAVSADVASGLNKSYATVIDATEKLAPDGSKVRPQLVEKWGQLVELRTLLGEQLNALSTTKADESKDAIFDIYTRSLQINTLFEELGTDECSRPPVAIG